MLSKVSLRLKLSDFINTDIEEKVMNIVNHAHNELSIVVLLYLWFEEGEIVSKDLKKFLIKWEDKLSFKTIIKQGHELKFNDFIWFDIAPVNTPSISWKRFTYSYSDSNKILDGLKEFYNVTKFTTSDKPVKRQKRNDYED
jgi:SUMO ligase MMS21 Smc5/6 complex component